MFILDFSYIVEVLTVLYPQWVGPLLREYVAHQTTLVKEPTQVHPVQIE